MHPIKNRQFVSVSQKRLRDLAPRAIAIAKRRIASFGVAEIATDLIPRAEAYIEQSDSMVDLFAAADDALTERRVAEEALLLALRHATVLLAHRMPGFDVQHLGGDAATPERLLSWAEQVLAMLGKDGGTSPAIEGITQEISLGVQKLTQANEGVHLTKVALQEARATRRESAQALNRELIALRRVLRIVLGTSHVDYRALRAARRGTGADEESEVAEEVEEADATVEDRVVLSAPVTNGAHVA